MTPEEVDKIINGYLYLHRVHQEITGSSKAGIMLSKACYYQEIHGSKFTDGFWYKTREAWECEAGITKDEFYLARKRCAPFLDMQKRGDPARTWYRVNHPGIKKAIEDLRIKLLKECENDGDSVGKADIGYVGKADEVCRESRHRVCRESRRGMSGKPTTYIDQYIKSTDTEEKDKKGSRARAKAPQASEAAISFVKSFQDRHPWYPRKPDPKQTARELEAAKYLLDNSTQEEVFRLVDRVMAGFRGNRRKVATLKDVWENFAALRIEFSDQSGLSSEASARIAEIETRREKTDAEVLADWDEAVECCRKEGLPDPVPRGYTRMLLEQRNGLQSVGSTGEV